MFYIICLISVIYLLQEKYICPIFDSVCMYIYVYYIYIYICIYTHTHTCIWYIFDIVICIYVHDIIYMI